MCLCRCCEKIFIYIFSYYVIDRQICKLKEKITLIKRARPYKTVERKLFELIICKTKLMKRFHDLYPRLLKKKISSDLIERKSVNKSYIIWFINMLK